jgi:thiol-disulfide isomerase/thioredoxin
MRYSYRIACSATALSLVSAALFTNKSPRELLNLVSETYDGLPRYEAEGTETTNLTDAGCTVMFPFKVKKGDTATYPVPAVEFFKPSVSVECNVRLAKIGGISPPSAWAIFEAVNQGVEDVRELPEQFLPLSDGKSRCSVLEVQYETYYQKIGQFTGAVQYWVDRQSHLIRRIEFTQLVHLGEVRTWTTTFEKVSIGVRASPPTINRADISKYGTLVGQQAPNFKLMTSDGRSLELAGFQGKVLLLDFWATWCFACAEEVPTLEKIQGNGETAPIVLGITAETAAPVRDWLKENDRSFRTLVNAQNTFDQFGVKSIPTLVVIDRRGIVVDYRVGFISELQLKKMIPRR